MLKLWKWLAVVAALLAAAGYQGESQLLRKAISMFASAGEAGAEHVQDVLSGLVEEEQGGSQKAVNRQNRYSGRVSKISDGDTLRVTDSNGQVHKIRMAYIDAPESQQRYGAKSRLHLASLAESEQVSVTVFEIDRYGREVAQVKRGDVDLNLAQLKAGAAWHYVAYAKKQSRSSYAAYASAEQQARSGRKGLWADKTPQAPWDYRQQQRTEQNSSRSSDSQNKWFGLW